MWAVSHWDKALVSLSGWFLPPRVFLVVPVLLLAVVVVVVVGVAVSYRR